MSETTAPLLATRDALAKALASTWIDSPGGRLLAGAEFGHETCAAFADALLESGVVRDPATLADDEALVERATRNRFGDAGVKIYPGDFGVTRHAFRALAAALTEDPS